MNRVFHGAIGTEPLETEIALGLLSLNIGRSSDHNIIINLTDLISIIIL
jgi:hypothetical protein